MINPPGPVPVSEVMSTPCSLASLRTSGEMTVGAIRGAAVSASWVRAAAPAWPVADPPEACAGLPRRRRREEPPDVVPYPMSTLPEDSWELSSADSSAEGWVPARSSSR